MIFFVCLWHCLGNDFFLLITHRLIRLWWMLSQPFIRLKLGRIVWTILKLYGLSINDIVSKWAICNPRPVMSFLFHWVSVKSSFGASHSLPLLMTLFMDRLYLNSFFVYTYRVLHNKGLVNTMCFRPQFTLCGLFKTLTWIFIIYLLNHYIVFE